MITAASEDATYNPADQADLAAWDAYFGLDFPVLLDAGALTDRVYDPMRRSRPTYVLLAPGAVIVEISTSVTAAEIEAVLPVSYP